MQTVLGKGGGGGGGMCLSSLLSPPYYNTTVHVHVSLASIRNVSEMIGYTSPIRANKSGAKFTTSGH